MKLIILAVFIVLIHAKPKPVGKYNKPLVFKTPWLVVIQICEDGTCNRRSFQSSRIQSEYCPLKPPICNISRHSGESSSSSESDETQVSPQCPPCTIYTGFPPPDISYEPTIKQETWVKRSHFPNQYDYRYTNKGSYDALLWYVVALYFHSLYL